MEEVDELDLQNPTDFLEFLRSHVGIDRLLRSEIQNNNYRYALDFKDMGFGEILVTGTLLTLIIDVGLRNNKVIQLNFHPGTTSYTEALKVVDAITSTKNDALLKKLKS